MSVDARRAEELSANPSDVERAQGTARGARRLAGVSARARATGRVVSGVTVAFLLFDAAMKLAKPPFVVEATARLGYPAEVVVPLGVVLLASTLLYVVPRTSPLGAILLTGYLGGAIASHVRVGDPLASHVLFPSYVAVLLWGGSWLRDARLRALVSLRPRRGAAANHPQ